MKLIFLDFDGVLNNDLELADYFGKNKDNDCVVPEMIGRLNKIVEATGAKVVISSTWRNLFDLDVLSEKYLKGNGFIGEVIDKTPDHGRKISFCERSRGLRGSEIKAWLDKCEDNVEAFVILDDDADMEPIMDHLVQTSFHSYPADKVNPERLGGLQDEHVQKAIDMLNK
jgi:hypothetical protein